MELREQLPEAGAHPIGQVPSPGLVEGTADLDLATREGLGDPRSRHDDRAKNDGHLASRAGQPDEPLRENAKLVGTFRAGPQGDGPVIRGSPGVGSANASTKSRPVSSAGPNA